MAGSAGDRVATNRAATPDSRGPRLTVFGLGVLLAAVHLGALAVRPEPTAAELVLFEGAVGLVLAATEFRATRSLARVASLGLVFGAIVAGLTLAVEVGLVLWQLTLAFAVVTLVVGYGLHRYHLSVLGRLGGDDEY